MELTLQRKVISLKYDGKNYVITIPTTSDIMEFVSSTKKASEENTLEPVFALLEKCGLPRSDSALFDVWSLQDLVEALSKKKTN